MQPKLTGKVFITGKITAQTGLHIGGSKASLDIGGVDLNVIKTPNGQPFVPGSSLKGKLRSMLARIHGSGGITAKDVPKGERCDLDVPEIWEIFGVPGDEGAEGFAKNADETKAQNVATMTRLIVRDAFMVDDSFNFDDVELEYTEVKWENTINRRTGTAEHPRQLERVPAGVSFNFELVYDVYDDNKKDDHLSAIRLAMRLLEGDYIGGHGSRGYGKIHFEDVKFAERTWQDYKENRPASVLTSIIY